MSAKDIQDRAGTLVLKWNHQSMAMDVPADESELVPGVGYSSNQYIKQM